jgi:hypothetical protein
MSRDDWGATAALRAGSRDRLLEELIACAARHSGFRDWRDVLLGFAPFYDCAKRLGLDPQRVFEDAAGQVPDDVAGLLRRFGARQDVTLRAFGWVLDEDGAEPAYRFALSH